MQLKVLGLQGATSIELVTAATAKMTVAETAAALATTGLNAEKQIQILMDKGLTRAEAEAAVATAAHSASTTAATGVTLGLTGATNSLIVALKGLWASMMSNPITAIITLALTLIVTITRVVSSIKQGAEEAAQAAREASQEIKDSFSSAMTTISDNLTTLNSLKEEFAKLSKGVDTYGNNISLTADEYERYKEIVQTIVGISPELVAGYDNEGNALANKNGLLEKSIELMQEEQRLKKEEMVTDGNLWTVAKGNIQDIKDSWDAIDDMTIPNDLAYSGVKIEDGKKNYGYINHIPEYVEQAIGIEFDEWNDNGSLNYIAKNIDEVYAHLDEILNNARTGFTDENGNVWAGLEETQIASLKSLIISIKSYTDDVEEASNEFNEYLQLIPQSMRQYSELDDPSKDFLSRWIRSFDIDEDTSESEIKSISEKIRNFTKRIADDENIELVLGAAVKLDTDKNSEKMTVAEYQAAVDSFMTQLGTLDEDAQAYIKVAFGIDGDENEWDKAVNDKIKRVKNILKNEDDDKVYGLSMGDLEIAYNIQADTDSLTFEELKEKIEQYKADLGTISFDSYFEDAKSLISELDSVRSIIESQSIGVSISVEDYNSEELADYTSALEYNNGVLQLNAEKVREIANAKAEETIATNDANKAMAQTEYLRNAAEIERLRKKIADKNYATNESEESVQKNIDALLLENDTLQKECNTYDLITSSLREATNAYNNWLNAQNASQRGDMFDDTLNAINRVNETLNDTDSDYFGRVGRTDYKAAVELIVPESIDPEDSEKVNAYLKSVYDLFTYDDDGNYAGLNIANFCQKAVDAGLMVLDESGENYQIAGSKTMEDFAEGLNLSLPLVQAMFGEMEEFGGEFSWADEANKTIGDLAVSANVAAENLRGLHSDMTITLDVSDLTTAKEKSDTLDSTIKQMQDLKTKVGVDSEEVEYANSIISYCITQKQQLSEPAILDVDVSKVSETTGEAVLLIQDFQKACNDLELKKALGLDTTDAQAKVDELYSQITSSDNDALLALKLDTTSVETVKSSIAGLTIDDIKAKLQIDDTALLSYQPEDKKATVKYDVDTSKVDNYNPKNLSRTVTYYIRTVGSVKANGTANLTGTAKAGGDWGTAQGGQTLTGELGREIVVDPHTGRWYTVGDTGAEFVNIPKGAIVFNHKQTESLLKNGYVAGRASALVGGTAMVTGGIGVGNAKDSSNSGGNSTENYGKSSDSKKSSSSKSNSSDEDKIEAFDWIEIAIDRIERAIDRLKKTAESTYKALKTKLGATADEITKVNQEIALQQQAYDRYMQEANSVGLDAGLAEKVRNGTIDINQYDEDTRNLISDYQDWYEKALDCSDAIDDLHESLASLYEDNFNNTQEDFENQLALAEHLTNQYENGIDLLEARGYLESTKHYSAMQDATKGNIAILNNELAALEQSFSDAMNSGEIEYGSAAWYEMQIAINGVKEEIAEANVELAEYAKTMREIEWGYFDYTQERISQLTQEADFLIDLMSNSDLHTDKGQLTDEGMATMGLHGQNYNTYMAQADMYAAEILEIDKELANDPYNTELIERREELLGLQQDSILAAEDEKQAIVALVEEGINLELQAMQDLIDKYTESLDTAKDLYEYQKKIKEQAANVASLQKQLSAYENDLTEETRAKVQKLTVELAKAEEELAESEYEQYISDQKKLLDELYLEYETILNQRLDNVDALIGDMITAVNDNSGSINETLTTTADNVGYTMTTNMQNIWNGATNALDGTISKYGDDFSTKFTAVQSVLSSIQANTAAMVAASDEEAQETVDTTNPETTPSAPTTPTTPPATQPTTPSTPEKTITVGGKINAKGAKIYDYAGDTSGENQYFSKDPIYKVLDEKNGYLKVRHHKLSSGVTGWFKKSDVKAYKTGGLVDYTGLAKVDGTPDKPELMLNAEDTKNFLELRDLLRVLSSQSLTVGSSGFGSPTLSGVSDLSRMLSTLRTANGGTFGTTIGDVEITIPIERVDDYNDFVTKLRNDPKFENMLLDVTIGRLAGGSSLAKNKYKW